MSLNTSHITAGDTLAAEIEAQGSSITLQELSLTGSDGLSILSVDNVTRLRENEYVGVFMPLSSPFLLKVVGRDENGFNYSHVRDTAVELSLINLSLGMLSSETTLIGTPG